MIGSVAAIQDLYRNRSSTGPTLDSLDGIRALAILSVVGAHSGAFHLSGHGGAGVWLFYALSAFLLTLPHLKSPASLLLSPGKLARYAFRRVIRVLPLYYATIGAIYLFGRQRLTYLTDHLVFARADNHFWSIPQELAFYAILPLLLLVVGWIGRGKRIVMALCLAVVAWASQRHLRAEVFAIPGNGKEQMFHLGVFCMGCAAAFVHGSRPMEALLARAWGRWLVATIGAVALVLLLGSAPWYTNRFLSELAWAAPLEPGHATSLCWRYPTSYGVLAALAIVAASSDTPLARLLSFRPLRAIGIVSFAIYLEHWYVLKKLDEEGIERGATKFFLCLFISYLIAVVTYQFLEKPLLSIGLGTRASQPRVREPEPLRAEAAAPSATGG